MGAGRAGRIIAAVVFFLIGAAIFALGLIERKNSDVGRKPAKLSDLLRPKQKSAGQRPAPGTNGLIFFLLVLVALFFYVLLVKR